MLGSLGFVGVAMGHVAGSVSFQSWYVRSASVAGCFGEVGDSATCFDSVVASA